MKVVAGCGPSGPLLEAKTQNSRSPKLQAAWPKNKVTRGPVDSGFFV